MLGEAREERGRRLRVGEADERDAVGVGQLGVVRDDRFERSQRFDGLLEIAGQVIADAEHAARERVGRLLQQMTRERLDGLVVLAGAEGDDAPVAVESGEVGLPRGGGGELRDAVGGPALLRGDDAEVVVSLREDFAEPELEAFVARRGARIGRGLFDEQDLFVVSPLPSSSRSRLTPDSGPTRLRRTSPPRRGFL